MLVEIIADKGGFGTVLPLRQHFKGVTQPTLTVYRGTCAARNAGVPEEILPMRAFRNACFPRSFPCSGIGRRGSVIYSLAECLTGITGYFLFVLMAFETRISACRLSCASNLC